MQHGDEGIIRSRFRLFFPNTHAILKIAATHPVTSCECEWFISIVRMLMRLSNDAHKAY